MWTRQELEEIFPYDAEKNQKYLDTLFAKRKKVTLTNIVNARSIPTNTRQYVIWDLDRKLWEKAGGEGTDSIDGWRKFVKAVKRLDTEQSTT